MKKPDNTPEQFRIIPTDSFLTCKRCNKTFAKKKGNRKYCLTCRPLAFYENMRKSQKRYFQSDKGKVALKKAQAKRKLNNNIYPNPVQHPQTPKKEGFDSMLTPTHYDRT